MHNWISAKPVDKLNKRAFPAYGLNKKFTLRDAQRRLKYAWLRQFSHVRGCQPPTTSVQRHFAGHDRKRFVIFEK